MQKTNLFLASVGLSGEYRQVNPPLGLMYIAAWLREKFSLNIKIIAQRTEGMDCDTLVRRAIEFKSDIIGLSSLTPHAYLLPGIISAIRAVLPDALVMIGGPHASSFREQALRETGADLAVTGEGEISMELVMQAYLDGGDMSQIPGLLRRLPDGEVVLNPGTPPIINSLDSIPFPAYDLIDVKKYWELPSQNLLPYPRKCISLFTSRGCPYQCAYCHNVFGRQFRAHSAERVVEEIAFYKKQYGIKELGFVDDCFNLSRSRVISIAAGMLNTTGPLRMYFPNGVRSDLLDEQTIDALVEAGMYCCSFALESGVSRIQELINKRLDIDKFLAAVAFCEKKKVFCSGMAMLGFPTETAAEMEQTIQVATHSRLHTAEFYSVTPFPNTALHEYALSHMPETIKNVAYDNEEIWHFPVNLTAESDETLFYYQRKALRTFYMRPNRLFRIGREYPKPLYLPSRLPLLLRRMTKGL